MYLTDQLELLILSVFVALPMHGLGCWTRSAHKVAGVHLP